VQDPPGVAAVPQVVILGVARAILLDAAIAGLFHLSTVGFILAAGSSASR